MHTAQQCYGVSISPRTVREVREEEAADGNPCGPALPDGSAPRDVTAHVHQGIHVRHVRTDKVSYIPGRMRHVGAAWEIYPPNLGLLRSQGREAIGSGAVMPGARSTGAA